MLGSLGGAILFAAAICVKNIWVLNGARKTMQEVKRWHSNSDSPQQSHTRPEELKAA